MKRTMDLAIALPAFVLTMPVTAVAVAVATLDTRQWGIFAQERIGRHGRPFTIYKIRTMRSDPTLTTTATSTTDARITGCGHILRRYKLDELPQLFNVLRGDMSLVGPRPDVAGFADSLTGPDRIVLAVRPGITGPATILYRDEEALLAASTEPDKYNLSTLWPEKIRLNRTYVEHYTLLGDLRLITATIVLSWRFRSQHP